MNNEKERLRVEETNREGRRTLIKAAWTVPTVIAIGSVPAFAGAGGSPGGCLTSFGGKFSSCS